MNNKSEYTVYMPTGNLTIYAEDWEIDFANKVVQFRNKTDHNTWGNVATFNLDQIFGFSEVEEVNIYE